MPLINHLRRKACLRFAVVELFYQSMQSNEHYYHKTRAICKIVDLPDLGENSPWCYVNEGTAWILSWSRQKHVTYYVMKWWICMLNNFRRLYLKNVALPLWITFQMKMFLYTVQMMQYKLLYIFMFILHLNLELDQVLKVWNWFCIYTVHSTLL